MELHKLIKKLDDLLGSELGRNWMGDPVYCWKYSEDFIHHFFAPRIDGREGEEYETVHSNGLYIQQRKVLTRKMCPGMTDQWLVAMWSDAGSEEDWNEAFGDRLPWPRRGYYAPTNAALNPSELPDVAVTLEIIGLIRKDKKKTYADLMEEGESAIAYEEKCKNNRLDDAIADACTAFGNAKPGSVGNGVSFPLISRSAGKGTKTEVET